MELDDNVCLCMRVSLRKVASHLEVQRPVVASQLSECFGAGTGCGWCVPTLEALHRRFANGETIACHLDSAAYAEARAQYKEQKKLARELAARETPSGPVDSETESQ